MGRAFTKGNAELEVLGPDLCPLDGHSFLSLFTAQHQFWLTHSFFRKVSAFSQDLLKPGNASESFKVILHIFFFEMD